MATRSKRGDDGGAGKSAPMADDGSKIENPANSSKQVELCRGICIADGIETTDEIDQHGIPQWMQHSEYGYHHASPQAMGFATSCTFRGFNLPEFDLWLSAMGDCGAKKELLERRKLAFDAFFRNSEEDSIARHLEWMMLRRQMIERDSFLRPLAKLGKAVTDGRKLPKRPKVQKWIDAEVAKKTAETAKKLWSRAPVWLTDEIGFDRFQKRFTQARKNARNGRK